MSRTLKPGILLIDDEEEILEVITDCLNDRDYRIYTANDGKLALEILQTERIDLTILDLALPGVNGMELLKSFGDKFPQMKVMMVTGMGNENTKKEALKLGAVDYMTKPIDLPRLEEKVRDLVADE